jgi:hypothetical protein
MDDKDHVFARFKDDKPTPADRRETLMIPRRAGAPGSRSVEVVHVRSGGAVRDRPQRQDQFVRAASWDIGFPIKQTTRASMPIGPAAAGVAESVAHVMPASGAAAVEAEAAPAQEIVAAPRRGRGRPRKHQAGEQAASLPSAAHAVEPATPPRRGRGWPPKHLASESAAAMAVAARAEEPTVGPSHDLGRRGKQPSTAPTRRVADPFDASDEGANCMRCGYAVEPVREKRGLMTCSECG